MGEWIGKIQPNVSLQKVRVIKSLCSILSPMIKITSVSPSCNFCNACSFVFVSRTIFTFGFFLFVST